MIGRVVGNYRIVRELGSGAMGAVYEGVDVMVERPVAIKMLRAEIARQPDLIERFRVEAVTLAKLNHPCIATLYSFFREGEDYYMVMEFVRGRTLEDVIKESGRMPAKSAADVMCRTLDGMAHAHQLGILHRDIKPANIMITGDGRVKVTDFGIARVLGSSRMTREGRIIGTLEYIAPERIRGEETDARSDLYSAGIVLYEMLSGRLPFTSSTDFALMQAHLSEAPPPLVALGVNCPPELEAVVTRALAKSAADRYPTAVEFRDAITAALPQRATRTGAAAVPPGMKPTRLAPIAPPAMAPTRLAPAAGPVPAATAPPPPAPAKPARTPWLAIGAGLAALLVAGASTIWYFRKPAGQTVAVNTTPAVTPPVSVAPAQGSATPATQGSPLEQPGQVAGQIPQTVEQQLPIPVPRDQAPAPQKPAPAKPVTAAKPSTANRQGASAPPPAPVDSASANPAPVEPPPSIAPLPPNPPPPVVQHRSVRTIRDVHKLYIDRMPAELKEYVAEEISKQLPDRVVVVTRRDDADAVMTGKEESADGLTSKVGGMLGMRDKSSASATITDLNKTIVLWTSQAGDKSKLIVRKGGTKEVAKRLVASLRKAINE